MMFGRKKKPPPAVVPKVTVTRTTRERPKKGDPPVPRQQQEELTLETLDELPDDPVALVGLYKSIKPQYQQAMEIAGQLAATMNMIADKLDEDSDGEITLAHVDMGGGGGRGGMRQSRVSQAARMAANLMDDEDVSVRTSRNGYGSQYPKSRAGQQQFRRPSGQPMRQYKPEPQDQYEYQPTDKELYPGVPMDEEQLWQAQQETPRQALAAKMQYVPPQGRISGSDAPEAQIMDPEIAELRAEARGRAEMGLQQRLQGMFINTAARQMARSPIVAQVPVGMPNFGNFQG